VLSLTTSHDEGIKQIMEYFLVYFAIGVLAWGLRTLVWKPRKRLEFLEMQVADIDEFVKGRLRRHIELDHNKLGELDTRFTSVERFLFYSGIGRSKIEAGSERQLN